MKHKKISDLGRENSLSKTSLNRRGDSTLLIGSGAGFSHDRPDAGEAVAKYLAAQGGGYLIYETLSERTVALAQLANNLKQSFGRVEEYLSRTMPICLRQGVKIIGNFGAANPHAAVATIIKLAQKANIPKPRVGVVTGDNLMVGSKPPAWLHEYLPPNKDINTVISANVYTGADGIAQALNRGADIVVAGRVADPSLTVAALMHAHNIDTNDWQSLALGTLTGHLLECGSQVSGGYFYDSGAKKIANLDSVGFPIAEVNQTQQKVSIFKPPGTGGLVSTSTVKEQLLYEIHDPSAYQTPDVTVDMSAVQVNEETRNRVSVRGVTGRRRPEQLRLQICLRDGWTGEAEISYYGQTAPARADMACDILRRRLRKHFAGLRYCLNVIGSGNAITQTPISKCLSGMQANTGLAYDLRVRLAAHDSDQVRLQRALWEVECLYTNGPAAGGGVRAHITPRLTHHIASISREKVHTRVRVQ